MKKIYWLIRILLLVLAIISAIRLFNVLPDVINKDEQNASTIRPGNSNIQTPPEEEEEIVYMTSCAFCDAVYDMREHSSCPNVDCPSHSEEKPGEEVEYCPICGFALSPGGTGCINPDCGKNVTVPEVTEWLFQNEYIDSNGREDLPVPVAGVSYTLFVDGEEICTATAMDYGGGEIYLDFSTEDYRIWFRYQGGDWHFHPIDSQVKSGFVSIRINGAVNPDVQYCSVCGLLLGEATSRCPDYECSSNWCPVCGDRWYAYDGFECQVCIGYCDYCEGGYIIRDENKCSNPDCLYNNEVGGGSYGLCGSCNGYLLEGGSCPNTDCPAYHP